MSSYFAAPMLLRLVSIGVIAAALTDAQSCGREAIPYLISVNLAGKPELACDTPACFGPLKSPLIDDSAEESRNQYSVLQRTATCTGRYTDAPCAANDEWTGGVAEYNNGTHISLTMECCRFEGLNYATEHKIAMVRPGERFVGGPVKEDGRLIAFDLIKEVRKNVSPNNEIHYVVHIYRMSCVPAPVRPTNDVDPTMTTGEYLTRRLTARPKVSSEPEPNRLNRYSRPAYNSHYDTDYYVYERPFYRRPGFRPTRRRYKPVVEYEYYDEAKPARRRVNVKQTDVLWPVEEETRAAPSRAHASKNYDTGPNDYPAGDAQKADDLPSIYNNDVNAHESTVTITPPPQRDSYAQANLVVPAASQETYAISVQPSVGSAYVAPPPQTSYALQPVYAPAQQPAYSYPQTDQSSYSTYQQTADTSACTSTCCTPSCSMNGMFSSLQCFSGDMMVQTPSGSKRMDALEVGDLVMSMDGSLVTYSKVVMFLHRKPEEDAFYNVIKTESGTTLKITDYHLLYRTSCQAGDRLKLVKAADVKVGECLHLTNGRGLMATKIQSIEKMSERGIYAPLTTSGDMFVNNALVSCHSNMAAQTLQQTFFAWWRKWKSMITSVSSMLPSRHVVAQSIDGDLPFGVEYLTTVVDLFVPQKLYYH